MTPTPRAPTNNVPPGSPRPVVPPEEQFWKRYSPQHEFPLSGVIAVTLYGLLAVAGFVLILVVFPYLFPNEDPLPIEAVAMEGGGGGTGGTGEGNPQTGAKVLK